MIEFYTNPMSRGAIVHWMLEELGEPYETNWIEMGPEGTKSAAYLAINSMGKVPAIRHDGKVVTEAAAIIMYLADVFPEAGLAPEASERADYYRWMLFAAGPVEQAVLAKTLGWTLTKQQEGTAGFGNYEATMGALDGMLSSRPYVCGDRFTAADVYVGSQVGWGLMFGTIEATAAFSAYAQRLQARAAYVRSNELIGAKVAEAGGNDGASG